MVLKMGMVASGGKNWQTQFGLGHHKVRKVGYAKHEAPAQEAKIQTKTSLACLPFVTTCVAGWLEGPSGNGVQNLPVLQVPSGPLHHQAESQVPLAGHLAHLCRHLDKGRPRPQRLWQDKLAKQQVSAHRLPLSMAPEILGLGGL